MYITYTFVHLPILLIRQIFRTVALLVPSSLGVETLSIGLRASLGLLLRTGNRLAVLLEVTLGLAFLAFLLETGGLIHHDHLMFFLYLHFCSL